MARARMGLLVRGTNERAGNFVERDKGFVESGLEAAVHERQQVLFVFRLGLLVNTGPDQRFLHDGSVGVDSVSSS